MPTPNLLNFRCINFYGEKASLRSGYRMATVEEVRNHKNTIARLGIQPLHPHQQQSIKEGDSMMLLDGYMTFPSNDHFQLQQTHRTSLWRVVVKEKEWDEDAGTWRTKSSACYSWDGVFLRKQLYAHISLPDQARQTALLNAWCCEDIEVVCWLLTTTSSEELQRFKTSRGYNFYLSFEPFMTYLLTRNFPFLLPLELDTDEKTVIDYAFELAGLKYKIYGISVVDLLLELFSAEIVHWKNSKGKSFLDLAEKKADERIHIFTKLLSVCEQPLENHIVSIKPRFRPVLLEAVERGYARLVEKLLDFKGEMTEDISLLMEVLREIVRRGSSHLLQKLLELYISQMRDELARKEEEKMRLLCYAAESGNPDVFQNILSTFASVDLATSVDKFEKSVLHWAAQGKNGYQIVDVLVGFIGSPPLDLMKSRDNKGRTPLHIASSKGNKKMVDKLLTSLGDDRDKVTKYVKETDSFGRTALQMASGGGHKDIVKEFLNLGEWDPLKERDVNGKTVLHYAAQAKYAEDGVAICQKLLEKCNRSSERSFLLWASAGGIGTADKGEGVHHAVKTFLQSQKASDRTHLLIEAALENNVELAWELLNRGADINDLRIPGIHLLGAAEIENNGKLVRELLNRGFGVHDFLIPEGDGLRISSVSNVLHQLDLLKEQARDQPSMDDKLGRNVFAEGLAALFLNRFIESPITVGICGEWGMGKSSLMIQTEKLLLITAAQLTFPNLLEFENFVGAKKISLSTKGRKIYQTIKNGACSLFVQEEDRSQEILLLQLYHKVKELVKNFWPPTGHRFRWKDPLLNILQDYQPQYHAIYKSLACMDSCRLLDSPKRTTLSQDHALREVPRILTIQYNAWHYRDECEAWAGLAVTVTKEIEKSMTRAQWFSTCWRYTWNKSKVNIYIQLFLPCLLATFLAGWIAFAVWILLMHTKFKDLKYGSIPITIIATVWTILKSVMSVVKPVSVQMLGYITLPDHTNRLGYQEQVISDINFLKTELGRRPHWFFSFISGEWCWNWFGLFADNVENSCIKKFRPASEDQLRIITFVDDLDRCEEKVILQVLSAVNLVLARCKINVVMGIDKKMIERAIRRSYEDTEGIDLAEKYLCKIIQIPLSLPDPTEDETKKFLEDQLGRQLHRISSENDDTDYGTTDEEVEPLELEEIRSQNEDITVLNILCCNAPETMCPGIIKKAADWLIYLLKCFYSIACNISTELKQMKDQSSDHQMCPLTFSKGARLTREMLITNYSKEEADTFDKLRSFATGNQKLPREWKRLFNYHKLAWNILSKRGDVQRLPTWRVELVVWVFVCWQWKHEMNALIKGWRKFASMNGECEDSSARGRHGPPLSQIVNNCVHELQKSENSEEAQGNSAAKKGDGFLKVRGSLKHEKSVTIYVEGNAEEDLSRNGWDELKEALQIQDVSMKGIQLFQQFRLHCETDHLPWPVNNKLKVQ